MAVRSGFVCMLLKFYLLCARKLFSHVILIKTCCLHNVLSARL